MDPVTFPVNNPAPPPMLPTLALPVTPKVPTRLAPVLLTTHTLAVPATLVLTLPLPSTNKLLVPFSSEVPPVTVKLLSK